MYDGKRISLLQPVFIHFLAGAIYYGPLSRAVLLKLALSMVLLVIG